jgi:hypothetical protein
LMNDTAREFGNCEASRDYEFDRNPVVHCP